MSLWTFISILSLVFAAIYAFDFRKIMNAHEKSLIDARDHRYEQKQEQGPASIRVPGFFSFKKPLPKMISSPGSSMAEVLRAMPSKKIENTDFSFFPKASSDSTFLHSSQSMRTRSFMSENSNSDKTISEEKRRADSNVLLLNQRNHDHVEHPLLYLPFSKHIMHEISLPLISELVVYSCISATEATMVMEKLGFDFSLLNQPSQHHYSSQHAMAMEDHNTVYAYTAVRKVEKSVVNRVASWPIRGSRPMKTEYQSNGRPHTIILTYWCPSIVKEIDAKVRSVSFSFSV